MPDRRLLDAIRGAWSWTGLEPREVVASNAFGNALVKAADGSVWRICPEELGYERVAADETAFRTLFATDDFQIDWRMDRLVDLAAATLGPLADEDRCYCLKMPAVFGYPYDASNLGTISRIEVISFSGELAHQIENATGEARNRDDVAGRSE